MRGTEKYPVRTIGEIDALEIDHDIFGTFLGPPDKITLKLIVSQLYPYGLMPYYMKFIFYDFHKTVHLFLFNAKVMKINEISLSDHSQQYSLEITSTKNAEWSAAYKVFATKHKGI
jgi:hypothetical protein